MYDVDKIPIYHFQTANLQNTYQRNLSIAIKSSKQNS